MKKSKQKAPTLGEIERGVYSKKELVPYQKAFKVLQQSMQDVLAAGARLVEAIRTAKVTCRRKEPHLSIVK